MKLIKLINSNIDLRTQKNTMEIKYNVAAEELLDLYREKEKITKKYISYRESAVKYKNELREIKIVKSDLEFMLKQAEEKISKLEKRINRLRGKNETK